MPPKKNLLADPPRKSNRQHVRDISPKAKKPRKMTQKSAEQPESSGVVVQKRPRGRPPLVPRQQPVAAVAFAASMPKKKSSQKIDGYCWLCHKEWPANEMIDRKCNTCPRVYHHQCLGPSHRFTEDGLHCPECRLQTTDGTPLRNVLPINELAKLLRLVLRTLVEIGPDFKTWPQTGSENEKCVRMMELGMLEDRLKLQPSTYSTTGKFFADIKWIAHNCHIIYGANSSLTNKAKLLVKHCKEELNDLEACPECYLKSHVTQDTFAEVCDPAHTLVWAKMKGFPYWPAKVLKVIDGVANIRFFGSHEKAKVPVANCLMLSQTSPNTKQVRNKKSFDQALEECKSYIQNFEDVIGPFPYCAPQTQYTPGSSNHLTKFTSKPSHALSKATSETRPKRGRPPKAKTIDNTDCSEENVSPDISADNLEIELVSDDDEIEIIDPNMPEKNVFFNRLELSSRSGSRSSQWQNMQQTTAEEVQLDFVVDEQNCADPYLKLANNPVPDTHNEMSVEDIVASTMEYIITCIENRVAGVSGIHLENTQANEISPNLEPNQVAIEISYTNPAQAVSNNQPLIGGSGYNSVLALPNGIVTPHNVYGLPVQFEKYVAKIIAAVQSAWHGMYSDMINMPGGHHEIEKQVLRQRIQELEKEIARLEKRSEIMKKNTDSVIKKMKKDLEQEKQNAIENAKRLWEKEQQAQNELHESQMRKQFDKEMQKKFEFLRARWEEEKILAVEEGKAEVEKQLNEHYRKTRQQWELETKREVSETKKHQWCAKCEEKSMLYCCWNTSYCSKRCQTEHWPMHMDECKNESTSSNKVSMSMRARLSQETPTMSKTAVSADLGQHLMAYRKQGFRGHTRGTSPCAVRPAYDSPQHSPMFRRGKSSNPSRKSNSLKECVPQNAQPHLQSTPELSPSAPQLLPNFAEPVTNMLSQSASAPTLSPCAPHLSPCAPQLSPSVSLPSPNTPSDSTTSG